MLPYAFIHHKLIQFIGMSNVILKVE